MPSIVGDTRLREQIDGVVVLDGCRGNEPALDRGSSDA